MKKWMKHEEWIHLVPKNAGKLRANHIADDCSGDSDSMIVERREDGSASAHCFRCGGRGFSGADGFYRAPKKGDSRANGTAADGAGETGRDSERGRPSHRIIPEDLTDMWTAFPIEVRHWLIKAGITHSGHGFKWSDEQEALYIPVLQGSLVTTGTKHAGWVIRGFNPKSYLTLTDNKDEFYGHYVCPTSKHKTIVLVEDVLSAIRVADLHDSISLLGVHAKPSILTKLFSCGYTEAIIFLDGDNTQVKMKARELAKKLCWMNTRVVETGHDPKEYSKEELDKLLNK